MLIKPGTIKLLALVFLCFLFFDATRALAEAVYIDPQGRRIFSMQPLKGDDVHYQKSGMRVLYRSKKPRDNGWLYSSTMSRACRKGTFKQRANRRYIAYLGEEIYGAARGGHKSLVDKEALSQTGVIYIFKGQGATNCRVYYRKP